MKTELKARILQHLFRNRKKDEGFTLIELLVVIIIIGILSAIALPSFLNQANKAKQSEAKTYVGSMNRAQQAFYAEENEFAEDDGFARLGLGVASATENYEYDIEGKSDDLAITNRAKPVGANSALKAYIGGVALAKITTGTGNNASSDTTTIAKLCEANASVVNGGDDASKAKFTMKKGGSPDDFKCFSEGTGDKNYSPVD